PGIHVAVRRKNRVAGAGVHLDDIVILFVTAKVTRAVGGLGPLVRVVKAPILPVDVKMVKVSAFARLPLGQLSVPRKLVAQSDEPVIPVETPRVIFKCSKIKAVECAGATLACKRRIAQLRGAVFRTEKEAERVFW